MFKAAHLEVEIGIDDLGNKVIERALMASNAANIASSSGTENKKAEKIDKVKKEDVVERYKEINDQLDDIADALDKASSQADRLWGKDRLAMMKQ
jgi:hypothetical protein